MEISQIKTKTFGRHFELAKQKFSSRDPSNYTRARHARMAQFWLKIAHLPFSIATTPLLKIVSSYGLRPRLWLLMSPDIPRPIFFLTFISDQIYGMLEIYFSCNLISINDHRQRLYGTNRGFWKLLAFCKPQQFDFGEGLGLEENS